MASPAPSRFIELLAAKARWTAIRDEAVAALRAHPGATTLRLYPEPEGAALAPATVALMQELPSVIGAAFSVLAPGGRSAVARGPSRHVAALLCLQSGGASHITIEGTRHDLVDGGLVVYDQGAPRESANEGTADRVVLLLLLDPDAGRPSDTKALALRALDEIFGAGRLHVANELFEPALAAEVKASAAQLRASFPDLEITVEHVVAEGGKVACAWRGAGTHRAPFFNVPATGARVTWSYQSVYVVRGGRVVAMTWTWDMLGVLQQLRAALRA